MGLVRPLAGRRERLLAGNAEPTTHMVSNNEEHPFRAGAVRPDSRARPGARAGSSSLQCFGCGAALPIRLR